MLATSPALVTDVRLTPPIAVVAVCDCVVRDVPGNGPIGWVPVVESIELVPAAERRAPPKSFAAPAFTSSEGTRSALAYEKSYDVVAAVSERSITGVTVRPEARLLIAAERPADHALFPNFVALAASEVVDAPDVRAIDGAIVSALEPTPVTSVALPALTASDATLCDRHGLAMTIASVATVYNVPNRKKKPPWHRAHR